MIPHGFPDFGPEVIAKSQKRNLRTWDFCTPVGADLVLSVIFCLLNRFRDDLNKRCQKAPNVEKSKSNFGF